MGVEVFSHLSVEVGSDMGTDVAKGTCVKMGDDICW